MICNNCFDELFHKGATDLIKKFFLGYYKMGNEAKARMAFERAQELDPNCVGALVGQAILDLNAQKTSSIQVQMSFKIISLKLQIVNTDSNIVHKNSSQYHFFHYSLTTK